jgi:hypothetical protein
MIKNYWNIVMDERYNPLSGLPMAVRFQIMTVLAMMWSLLFCMLVNIWDLFPYWIVGHIVILTVGCLVTNYTFTVARKLTHRDMYRSQDGLYALYDDYWGS